MPSYPVAAAARFETDLRSRTTQQGCLRSHIPTRDNSAILFLDLQDEIVKNSCTLPIERLMRTTGALARLAALHEIPRLYLLFRRAEQS